MPFTALHKETNGALWSPIKELHGNLSKLQLTSSYGLFRRMTGTEKGRPEVILEYSNNMNGPWKEFSFLYKPGDVSAAPKFVCKSFPSFQCPFCEYETQARSFVEQGIQFFSNLLSF